MNEEQCLDVNDWDEGEEPNTHKIEKELDLVEYLEKGGWDEVEWE